MHNKHTPSLGADSRGGARGTATGGRREHSTSRCCHGRQATLARLVGKVPTRASGKLSPDQHGTTSGASAPLRFEGCEGTATGGRRMLEIVWLMKNGLGFWNIIMEERFWVCGIS